MVSENVSKNVNVRIIWRLHQNHIISDPKLKKIAKENKAYICALFYAKTYFLMNNVKICSLDIKTKSSNS